MRVISKVIFLPSAARTTSGDTRASRVDASNFYEGLFFLDVTAVSGTSPTLDVVIETYDELSGKWFPIATFSQFTATGSELKTATGLGQALACRYTIGGTEPSFTFSVGAILKS